MNTIPRLRAGTSLDEALRRTAQAFEAAGIGEAQADARLLVGHALQLDRVTLLVQNDRILESCEIDAIAVLAARRLKHEPVSRILGRKEFWSLPLIVTPDVLVPRPETETLVELALDLLGGAMKREGLRVLDIGTGSGALLLALLTELPNAVGIGTDISAAALQTARANAERNGLAERCSFVACNMAAGLTGRFDLVVSNPPYIARGDIAALPPEVRDYDPTPALDGGNDGLDAYRALAAAAPGLLAAGGRLIVELGAGQELAVSRLLDAAGLEVGSARKDLAGIARALPATSP